MAGVVGRRKFIYDVWGDAVNIASCMEAAGAGDRINVSEAVQARVKSLFEFEPRGSVEAKNKGRLNMFYLSRLKPELSRDAAGLIGSDALRVEAEKLFPDFPERRSSAVG